MRPVRKADNLPPSSAIVTKSGNLNFLEPSGPLQACKGTALHLLYCLLGLFLNSLIKKKVKCTLVQALRPCTGRTAHRGSRGIALLFLDHGSRRGWGISVTPWPFFIPGKDLVPIVQEAGWAPGPVWTGAENLASTGIRSPDRPARSQSLYRLRYPALTPKLVNKKLLYRLYKYLKGCVRTLLQSFSPSENSLCCRRIEPQWK